MPHQRPDGASATTQNAAGDKQQPNDTAREAHLAVHPDPSAYAAGDVADATVAPPAAGETSDYMDEDDPSFGMQQGANHTNREAHRDMRMQGAKTQAANRQIVKGQTPH